MVSGILEQIVAGEAPPLVSLTADQYHRLTESGVLPEGSPIELIDGFLVHKDRGDDGSRKSMNHGPMHALVVSHLMRVVSGNIGSEDLLIWCQSPIAVSPQHEPEPDVTIIEGVASQFRDVLPTAKETLAVMEVAHSSRDFDRGTKQRIYAEATIPIYVVVDLVESLIDVYTDPIPNNGRYRDFESHCPGVSIELELRTGTRLEFDVDQVLPANQPIENRPLVRHRMPALAS